MLKLKNILPDLPEEFKGLTDPMLILTNWIQQAQESGLRDANAMTLSTVDDQQQPHSRVVLCKEMTQDSVIFYSNYESHKAQELNSCPKIALNFFWHDLHLQVRLEGPVAKTSKQKSEDYWQSRPRGSQLAQLLSKQSQPVASREAMESQFQELEKNLNGQSIPCPDNWGGYALAIQYFEFWIGRQNRFHDRICFTKVGDEWQMQRLYP